MPSSADSSTSTPGRSSRTNLLIVGGLALVMVLLAACVVLLAGGLLLLRMDGGDGRAAEPAPAPAISRIAFVDGLGRLGTVGSAGHDRRLLTAEGTRFQFPAWSPDGTTVAAIGVDEAGGAVYTVPDRLAAQVQELYRSALRAPIYLYWSPDGRQLSFIANDRRSLALHLVPSDGSASSRVLGQGQPFYWDWRKDSQELLIHSGGLGEDARLAFVGTDGQVAQEGIGVPGLFQAPGISPSQRFLAYAAAETERFQVVIQGVDEETRVAVPHVGLAALGWSPVEDRLAYISPSQPRGLSFYGPLRLLNPTSGDAQVLVRDLVLAFFWSPDGRSIAYLTPDNLGNQPGAGLPGAQLASYLPQGTERLRLKLWVVEVDTGQRQLLTTFRPTDLFVAQFLPFFDQYALSHRLWSPDSNALVMPMVDSRGRAQVTVVPVGGDPVRTVVEGVMGFWSWQ